VNNKYNIFRLGSINEVVTANQCHNPPPPQYAKWGWCATMTLRQYLVCRECRKVAQHCRKRRTPYGPVYVRPSVASFITLLQQ
jgi:hypothetical protein